MKGVYPEGFPDWEIDEIEKFRTSDPSLYEWRKTSHLIAENVNRPIGRAVPVPLASTVKAGVEPGRGWTPAFAGEGRKE